MRILLTGASGFTGRYFEQAALNSGYEVIALESELTDRAAIAKEVLSVQPNIVVHLAAISFVGHADENAFYAVNVVGTENLLSALTKLVNPPSRVLLASSANVYGNCEYSPICESQFPAPINHYAVSKLAMEYIARSYLDRLSIVITRPFNYTGHGQSISFVIPKLVDHFVKRAEKVELGNLNVQREFNDVRMVCDAYLTLLKYGQPGEIYNICSGLTYTLGQAIDILSDLTGQTIKAIVNPTFVRNNEVHRLCGEPAKLQSLFEQADIKLSQPDLRVTLRWMLDEASS